MSHVLLYIVIGRHEFGLGPSMLSVLVQRLSTTFLRESLASRTTTLQHAAPTLLFRSRSFSSDPAWNSFYAQAAEPGHQRPEEGRQRPEEIWRHRSERVLSELAENPPTGPYRGWYRHILGIITSLYFCCRSEREGCGRQCFGCVQKARDSAESKQGSTRAEAGREA